MMVDLRELAETRARRPDAIAEAYLKREQRSFTADDGRLMVVAADHPARGSLRAGDRAMAMADRTDLLDRLLVALSRPGVDGLLAAPDIVEDLLLLGALENKVVIGSMNRGGLPGSVFEVDDRFTAYDADSLARSRLDAGKLLLRMDPADPATAFALERAANAVTGLAERRLVAMVEPFVSQRTPDGGLANDLSVDAVVSSAVIASGLGTTSAYTWLKLPAVTDAGAMEQVAASTSLPIVLLGGEVPQDPERMYAAMASALALPNVRGLTIGRSLLYPPGDDVAAAVDTAVNLIPGRSPSA